MSLPVHLLIHFLLSLLVGVIVWRIYKKPLPAFLGAVTGGFLIDFDHLIDYFFAFGFNFKSDYFFHGYQFLKSDKMYLLFHGWEYVAILIIVALVIRNRVVKTVLMAVALGCFVHLCTDIAINEGMSVRGYSVMYRFANNFDVEHIVTPEHYQNHKEKKLNVKFE